MSLRKIAICTLSLSTALCALAAAPQSTQSATATPAPQMASAQPQSLADFARKSRKSQGTQTASSHKTKVFNNDSFTGHGAPRPAGPSSSHAARKSHAKTAKKGKDPFQPQR